MVIYYYFRFCPSSWKCTKYRSLYFCPVVLPFSVPNIHKRHICEVYIFASRAYNADSRKTVTLSLDPNRPLKTGSRYNDILSYIGKPKSSAIMSQNSCLISLHTTRFSTETALGAISPPVAEMNVKFCFASVRLELWSLAFEVCLLLNL